MTRPLAPKAGLPGPGQLKFPEQAKEIGRLLGLTGTAIVLDYTEQDDGGGAKEYSWDPRPPVRARKDTVGGARQAALVAETIDETTTHIITLDGDVPISTDNRIEMEGALWAITAERQVTDQMVTRVEARETPS